MLLTMFSNVCVCVNQAKIDCVCSAFYIDKVVVNGKVDIFHY